MAVGQTEPATKAPTTQDATAELDARRRVGAAHYENDAFAEAATEFRRCIELAPDSAVDHFNLGLVLMRANEYEESLRALERARQIDPNLLGVYYIQGIVYKRQGEYDKAVESLKHVIAQDPQCLGAFYNLGVCYKVLQQYEEAIKAFEAAVQLSPTHPNSHYQLITLYRRIGEVDKAARHTETFEQVKDTVEEAEKTVEALERSKYSYIIEVARRGHDLPPAPEAQVRFVDVTTAANLETAAQTPPPFPLPARFAQDDYRAAEVRDRYVPTVGGAVALGDYDGDGDLDVYVVNCAADPQTSANRLYRNEGGGRFTDVTEAAGVGDAHLGMSAVFGDYDNDGHNDLYVVNCGPNVLYHNKGDGTFEDVSSAARANEPHFGRKAVFVDYDHDNDLDIFVGNDITLAEPPDAAQFTLPDDFPGEPNALLRNNGNGTFTDQTDEAGLLVAVAQSRDLLFADLDADHDIDLFVVNANAPSRLFLNARLGKFKTGGSFTPPIDKGARAAAEGDFNRDGKPDLLVAVGNGLLLYTNDGHAHFEGTPVSLPQTLAATGVRRIHVCDYNNDGWSDVLLVAADGRTLALLAGAGLGKFQDVSEAVGLHAPSGWIAEAAMADFDGDGDEDILLQTRDRGPRLLRNDGGNRGHWINVRLLGKKVNRNGYGSTVEIAAGGHYQKQTVRDGWVHFGLGDLPGLDVVRVTWPNGVAQNAIRPARDETLDTDQYVKVSASCAFLYAYNGRQFELVNEILGIGPLGVPMTPGVYHQPDCTELTKIAADQLVDQKGIYELRLTEELRETTYADQITLRVVDHPADLEIIPNEFFTAPPFPEDKFFAVAEHRPPVSAVDERGADVLPLVLARDGRFPTFPLTPYDGVAQPHALTLDLGDLSGADRITLFLDGWIYWAESSTVMALAQDPRYTLTPLRLEVRDDEGRWHAAIESVGLPTSKGLVVPVDLTGRFLRHDYHVRLSTTMCVYFDRVFVSTLDQAARCRMTELPAADADLHYRGFSRMTRGEFGFERFDYADVSPTGSWDPPRGRFTRYGPVTELLARPDDMYVIFGPGDELALRFEASNLPALPPGWTRDFIFYASGWVKDGDLNTTFSETVTPLPFHGMSGYPYPPSEQYPDASERQRYQQTYNTRAGRSTVGRLR